MSKKHEMSEHEYRIYQQQHGYEDPIEAEEGKVQREQAGYARHRKKKEARIRQQLRTIVDPESLDLEDDDLAIPVEDQTALRLLHNSRTHKKRLVGLRKHVDGS